MKGQLLLPTILIWMIISFLPVSCGACQLYSVAKTITVPDDYSSIQAAINAANPGDTVYIRNGTYYEQVDVNKTISLVGENKDATAIDGNGSINFPVLSVVDVSNVTIQDLTVQNGTYGLYLVNANITKLRNISLRNNQQNLIVYDPVSLQNTTEDIDESNTADGKPVYFWFNRENGQIPSDAGYVALVNCNNVTVRGPTLIKNGILLVNVKGCLIENVTVTKAYYALGGALEADDAENCTIRNSLFSFSMHGARLTNFNYSSFTNNTVLNMTQDDAVFLAGSFNTVSENTILNNSGQCGLYVAGPNNIITANRIINNTKGIILNFGYNNVSGNQIEGNFFGQLDLSLYTSFNTISGNRIVGNMLGNNLPMETGIMLYSFSHNNTIIENLIEGNSYGIYLLQSEYNLIFHNNIVNNVVQAYVLPASSFATHVYSNTWDNGYPSGGNHWGDYTGKDLNHDDIGDTQYAVYDANIDNYPLMNPYVVPEFHYVMYVLLFALSTLAIAVIKKRTKRA